MNTFKTWGIFAALISLTIASVSADDLLPDLSPSAGLANDLSGYWTFDETRGGVLHDYSGHGYNGSVVNYPGGQGNWTSGQTGGALQFGGPSTHEYVRVPNFAMPTHSMTLTAWVRANSLPRWATVAANWNGGWGAFNYATFGPSPNTLSLYVADANVQGGINVDHGVSSTGLSLNQWHFVAFVADSQSSTVRFMQDGVFTGGFGYLRQLPASSSVLNIGDDPSDTSPGQGNWDGEIDDLAIWTRALNPQELADIYNAGSAGHSLLTLLGPAITCSSAQSVECGSPATVTASVSDPLGAAMTVLWVVDGIVVQTNMVPADAPPTAADLSFTSKLPLGTNEIQIAVMDSYANEADCSTTVAVVDTTPPEIVTASAFPRVLWPPNHKLVRVAINAIARDGCDGEAGWKVIDIQSSQPVLGAGSGHTAEDWQILNDHTVALRAERAGASKRIYTLTLQAEDASGNLSASKTVEIEVP